MIISSIVATSENFVIGKDNDLPWHLPNDLKYFKRTTSNHTIIMGRNTYESIGRPLPNRENLIITRNKDYKVEGARCFHSLDSVIEYCEAKAYEEVFFIGGAQIYQKCIPWSNKLYITHVHTSIEDGTVFFPEINWSEWEEHSKELHQKDDKNAFDHTFAVYSRK